MTEHSTNSYGYTEGMQKEIIATLIFDKGSAVRLAEIIKWEYFDNPILQDICHLVLDYIKKFKVAITQVLLEEELRHFLGVNNKLPEALYNDMLTQILEKNLPENFEYVKMKARDFAQYQAIRSALFDSVDLLEDKRDYRGIVERVKQAMLETDPADNLPMVINAGEVTEEPLPWFWYNRIPDRCLTLLAGGPEAGKSHFAFWMIAQVTNGLDWPYVELEEHKKCRKGSVVLLAAEELLVSQALIPRLRKQGADKDKVHIIKANKEGNVFSLVNKDLVQLENLITMKGDIKLVVVDTLNDYLGGRTFDTARNKDVRQALSPLIRLAYDKGVTILAITHFSKAKEGRTAMERIIDSTAFTAISRSAWGIVADSNLSSSQDQFRRFCKLKSNYAINPSTIVWKINKNDDHIEILEEEPLTADEVMTADQTDVKRSVKSKALEAAKGIIGDRPELKAADVEKTLGEAGYRKKMIYEIKHELGYKSEKRGMVWYWVKPSEDSDN